MQFSQQFIWPVFGGLALLLGYWRWEGVPVLAMAGLLGVLASAIAVLPARVRVRLGDDRTRSSACSGCICQHSTACSTWFCGATPVPPGGSTTGPTLVPASWSWAQSAFSDYCGDACILAKKHGPAGQRLPGNLLRPVPSGRYVTLCFCCSSLVWLPPGLDWLIDRPLLGGRGLLFVTLAVVVDLASTSVQPIARNDKGFLIEAGRLLERVAPKERVVELRVAPDGGLDADMGPGWQPL